MSPHAETLRRLEERLLEPKMRADRDALAALLADGFFEFGSSGRRLTRNDVLDFLSSDNALQASISDFEASLLADDVALVTYRAIQQREGRTISSLRSSIWKKDGERWLLLFHQGTREQESRSQPATESSDSISPRRR